MQGGYHENIHMAVFKRSGSKYYWMKFKYAGVAVRESTGVGSYREALQIEAARRTEIVKGVVGTPVRQSATPTFHQFANTTFVPYIEGECQQKPLTVKFYKAKLRLILRTDVLSDLPLNEIDEAPVEANIARRRNTLSRHKKPLYLGQV